MSQRITIALGFLIVILLFTQYFFSPSKPSPHIKYVRVGSGEKTGKGSKLKPYTDLQYAIDRCQDGDTIFIQPGTYEAKPAQFIENLCGNCLEHQTPVKATCGFLIDEKGLTIIGSGVDKTVLKTSAGYGLLFQNSQNSFITRLTITEGFRDPDGNATDAGVVLKNSTVTVQECRIADNLDQKEGVVVGIGGIMVREGSELSAIRNIIINNGWDGIALYRGGSAYIADNVISKGRGAGIGITWDSKAMVIGNQISDYWKGIGTFGDARAVVMNNIVKDCLGWGIIATGSSYLDACNNIVYHNGNCGMATWSEEAGGRFSNNIVVLNGWKEQWVAPQVGIQNYGGVKNFIISHNNVWNNQKGNYGDMSDLSGKNGNISCDPQFLNPSTGDFRLKPGSPCINAGNPLITDADGTISDIGLSRPRNVPD